MADGTAVEVLRLAAFPDHGRGGNPAGVVLDASSLEDAEMLAIAAEVGYSESAFVTPGTDGDHGLRFFSPLAEVAFCGHATIATAVALGERDGVGAVRFHTPAGVVAVTTEHSDGGILAALTSPPASSVPADPVDVDVMLAAFGWDRAALDPAYPPAIGFAGNHHPILGVAERATLADFSYDFNTLAALMAARGWTTVHVFHARPAGGFDVRNAFPPGGVREDPATGAAAAAFGAYLRDLGRLEAGASVMLHQGEDMGSPSLLTVRVPQDSPSLIVAGGAAPIAVSRR